MALDTLDGVAAELTAITRQEPLAMRRARAAVSAAAALDVPPAGYAALDRGTLADMFADRIVRAREGLDGMTAARRNEEGFEGDELARERERAEEHAYEQIEALAELADHARGVHRIEDGVSKFCPAGY